MCLKKTSAIIIVTLICSFYVYAAEEPCKQEYIFSSPQHELLNIESVANSDISEIKEKNYSVSGSNYFVVRSGLINEILVYSGNKEGIKVSVKGYEHRPLSAKWINEKLIYFEVWFNPHFGAYWIYDIKVEKIVVHELQNDGWASFLQCREYYKNRK